MSSVRCQVSSVRSQVSGLSDKNVIYIRISPGSVTGSVTVSHYNEYDETILFVISELTAVMAGT